MTRAEVEAAIDDEERVLSEVASLIRAGAPWKKWPLTARRALMLAIDESATTTATSAWQARMLRRHLFGPGYGSVTFSLSRSRSHATIRYAERVRSNLARLVPLRSGCYLTR